MLELMMKMLFGMSAFVFVSVAMMAATLPAGDIAKTIVEKNLVLQHANRTYDTATIRGLISDDFTLIVSSGRLLTGEDFLADAGDRSVKWLNNDSEDVNVRVYNDDCAVVTAILHQRYEYKGKMNDYRVRFTDTWVKLGGSWRYVAGHASLLHRDR